MNRPDGIMLSGRGGANGFHGVTLLRGLASEPSRSTGNWFTNGILLHLESVAFGS